MSSSAARVRIEPLAVEVWAAGEALHVRLADGREISVPLEWFPRLRDAETEQLSRWRLVGGGVGIHWPDLDEDISIAGLLATQ